MLAAVTVPLLLAIAAAVVPGVALGDTASTPITCGMTISTAGAFTLSSDLTCGADNGGRILIRAQDGPVTLDLQGHTLSNAFISIPTFESSAQFPITIEHGTIEAGYVITVGGGGGCAPLTLTHLTINDSPWYGVEIYGRCGMTIRGVVISNSAGSGFRCDGASRNTTISNSLIINNGGGSAAPNRSGINLDTDCGTTTITDNTVTHNAGGGIEAYQSYGSVITDNLVTWNGGDGIAIAGRETSDEAELYLTYQLGSNTAIGNDGYGISTFLPVTDLGGNTSRHNGATAQCVNVTCVTG